MDSQTEARIQELQAENERLRGAIEEMRREMQRFLSEKESHLVLSPERAVVHSLRNILNELGLLRATLGSEEQDR